MLTSKGSTTASGRIGATASVLSAARQLGEAEGDFLTVVDGDRTVGVVTLRQLMECVSARWRPSLTPVSAVMTKAAG